MTALLISQDLLASSQLRGAAQAQQTPLAIVPNVDAAVARCDAEAIALVLLDLSLPEKDLQGAVSRLRCAAHPPGAIIAYGPHVHHERLAAASAAGCDEVWTRGQLHAQADALLARYSGSGR